MKFDGATYTHQDYNRLKSQFETIIEVMLAGDWFTVSEIHRITGFPERSISAQIRNAKKFPNWPEGYRYEVFREKNEYLQTVYKIVKKEREISKYEQMDWVDELGYEIQT